MIYVGLDLLLNVITIVAFVFILFEMVQSYLSAYLSDGTSDSMKKATHEVSFQTSEPVTPSTVDGADDVLFEQPSDCGNSELDVDMRDIQSKPRAVTAPSEFHECMHSASDVNVCQVRNRSRTVGAFWQPQPCERQVNSLLNKLTRERFESLYQQLFSICCGEDFSLEVINVVARGVFAKATVQHTFADMYAEVCSKLYTDLATQATRECVSEEFKRSLLEQCQNSFDMYLHSPPIDVTLNEEEQFEQLMKYKTRMLGNVRLIAHLIRHKILSSKLIFDCTDELLKVCSVETLESLCTFVSTLGDFFNAPEWNAHVQLVLLFDRIRLLSEDATHSPRIRFLIKNVLDERNRRSERAPSPPPAPRAVMSSFVLLGRTASVRGGVAHTIEDMKRKDEEKQRDEPAKHTVKKQPVLLGRAGPVQGREAHTSEDTKHKDLEKKMDEPAKQILKMLPVMLGHTGSVRRGDAPASVEMNYKEPEKLREGLTMQMLHSNAHLQMSDEGGKTCDTHCGQEASPSIALAVERTPLRSGASLFQPAISNQREAMVVEAAPKTTLMLRNIPVDFSRSAIIDVLRSEGFADRASFVYVPMNLRSTGNFGYAFVDFYSTKIAEKCKEQLEGFSRWDEPTEKALEIAWSETQGLDAQIARYRDSPLMHESVADEMKPALYKNGARIAFPAPTKTIRAPRLRKAVEPVEKNSQQQRPERTNA